MEIVKNMSTLKAMAKRGLIKLHKHTGKKIKELYGNKLFTCYYIYDVGDDVSYTFEYKGNLYQIEYFDGCFCPYVVKVSSSKKSLNNE